MNESCHPDVHLGGFIFPLLETGQPYKLRMMCCGVHWNSRTHKYMERRTNFDGKRVPAIPSPLLRLVSTCLEACQKIDPSLPNMEPNSLLVNYFDRDGSLGLHRDDDEDKEECMAGLTVVSITVGNSMEFYWLDVEDETIEKSVQLNSGDVMVVGSTQLRKIIYSIVSAAPCAYC